MPLLGHITSIKRNGRYGAVYPMGQEQCIIGRSECCDIRIQLPTVSGIHCKIVRGENGEITIENISKTSGITLNGKEIGNGYPTDLKHGDIFTIGDRDFKWEANPQ